MLASAVKKLNNNFRSYRKDRILNEDFLRIRVGTCDLIPPLTLRFFFLRKTSYKVKEAPLITIHRKKK